MRVDFRAPGLTGAQIKELNETVRAAFSEVAHCASPS
jgi:hypothetical protein